MKEINKRDMVLIGAIILIILIVAIMMIIPKNNNNEINSQNNSGDITANSPASPEELFSRPNEDEPLRGPDE